MSREGRFAADFPPLTRVSVARIDSLYRYSWRSRESCSARSMVFPFPAAPVLQAARSKMTTRPIPGPRPLSIGNGDDDILERRDRITLVLLLQLLRLTALDGSRLSRLSGLIGLASGEERILVRRKRRLVEILPEPLRVELVLSRRAGDLVGAGRSRNEVVLVGGENLPDLFAGRLVSP